MIRLFFASLVALAPAAVMAQTKAPAAPAAAPKFLIHGESYIARTVTNAKGQKQNVLLDPAKTAALPGDAVVQIQAYENAGTVPVAGIVIDSPVDAKLRYTGVAEAWASVSVDGGKTFGPLATLKVKRADGKVTAAGLDDVTNVRWRLAQPVAPGAKGRVMYYAVIR